MKIKCALVFYKQSAYNIYFLDDKKTPSSRFISISKKAFDQFKKAHTAHYHTLRIVRQTLRRKGIAFVACARGRKVNFSKYDLIITVGGDGTFLEAARGVTKQLMLGVNSDAQRSIGRFCTATGSTFSKVIDKIRSKKARIAKLYRLRLKLNSRKNSVNILNDILICHENPAAVSRYAIEVQGKIEEQRGSGLWIATAIGSSGAMKSAGGKLLNSYAQKMQYRPRELLCLRNTPYRFKGGILGKHAVLRVHSLMRRGMIYVDGAHVRIPFGFGHVATISHSPQALSVIGR